MKNIIAFCFILLGVTSLYAQNNATDSIAYYNKVFGVVQQKPKFPGNQYKWMSEHIVYPKKASDSNIQGTVYIGFTVEKDGSVDSVKVIRGIQRGSDLDSEAVSVVSNMPKWNPGIENGHIVRVELTMPVNFKIINDSNWDFNNTPIKPKFPGDIEEWLDDSIEYPGNAMGCNEQGTVYVSFVVEKDGSISNIKTLRSDILNLLDSEVVAVVSKMPRWTPGIQDGKPVRTLYKFAVHFVIKDSGATVHFPFLLDNDGKVMFPNDISYWISQQINYPEEAKKKRIQGTVLVNFDVQMDGSVSNIKVVKGVENGATLDNEAERIISVMPKWKTMLMVKGLTAKISFNLKNDSILKIQKASSVALDKNYKVYTITVKSAIFPGDLNEWLTKNIKYPQIAKDANVQGTVYISFIIESDGSVSGVTIRRGVNRALNDEAIRVVSAMPKWKPETKNDKPERVQYLLPIHFILN